MRVQRFFALLLYLIIFSSSNYQLSTSTVLLSTSLTSSASLTSTKSLFSTVITSTVSVSLISLVSKLSSSCRINTMMMTYAQDSYDSGINKRGKNE